LGVSLKDMERFDEALEVLSLGESLDNQRTDILNLQGFCHFKLGAHARAVERFKKILDIDPGSAIDYANVAVNYAKMGKTEKAIEYYSKALAIDPTLEWALDNLKALQSNTPE
jgi:ribosomal protein S12 methylthiotransferase accessory factor